MAKIIIRKILKEKKIGTEKIVKSVPFSRATVYRVLNGEKSPTLNELEEFAREIGVPLEDLYESELSREKFKENEK